MQRRNIGLAAIASLAFCASVFVPLAAHAEVIDFKATMNAATEVPAKDSKGTGDALASFDTTTKKLSYTVTYIDLTGPATMAHIHGPALPGANAPVVIPFMPPASPITGSVTLTDAQAADLMAGKYYVNVHTAANPGGEIRGQLVK
jgi:hypothetical protein